MLKTKFSSLFHQDKYNTIDTKGGNFIYRPKNNNHLYFNNTLVRNGFITLRLGSTGEEVYNLQEKLITLNYLAGTPDGRFGRNTERAVLNFQKDNNLLTDGIVGTGTWQVIELRLTTPIPVSQPTVKEGDKNIYVKEAQLKLRVLGFLDGELDGLFGPITKSAVQEFQVSRGLVDDGIIGPDTWRAINRAFSAVELPLPVLIDPMSEGMQGDRILMLNNALSALGYLHTETTEFFNEETTNAVKHFQEDNNLPVTGIVDQETWELIEDRIIIRDTSMPEIEEGSSDKSVIILQEKLKILGFFPGSITGSFGPETTIGVREFQKNYNLPVTGVVDTATWRELFKATANLAVQADPVAVLGRPTLRLGDSGPYVTELQTLLKDLMYYTGTIDGQFGSGTNTAVRTFQTNNKLTADGVVGRNTWSALIYLYSPLAICGGTTPPAKFVGVVVDAGHGGIAYTLKYKTMLNVL